MVVTDQRTTAEKCWKLFSAFLNRSIFVLSAAVWNEI